MTGTDASVPVPPWKKRRATDYIRQIPARNLHHAIRLADSKGLSLNTFVSINFSLTACPEEETDLAFQKIRFTFGKWVSRPSREAAEHKAPPTFVWVIENQSNCLNAHWLVHLPAARREDFQERLPAWLESAAGLVHSPNAIDMRPASNPKGAGCYMLKGMYPSMAQNFGIEAEYQGWVTGRRIGHSKNLGPVQLGIMRSLGKHPRARPFILGLYGQNRPLAAMRAN
jgi:hypothetical protein